MSAESRTLRFSQIRHALLVDRTGEQTGRVDDLIVRLGSERYPVVTGVQGRIGNLQLFIPISQVATLAPGKAALGAQDVNLGRFERREGEVLVGQDILGHHLIDVDSGRLITARDIELKFGDGKWELRSVDTRHNSPLRRLLHRGSTAASRSPLLVDWSRVAPLVGHVPTAKLRLPLVQLRRLHPAQIADLVEAASHDEGAEIIATVGSDPELEAHVFEELDDEHQVEFLKSRSDIDAAHVVAGMAPDDAADIVAHLPLARRASILERLPQPEQEKVRSLLAYHPDTAGGLMTTDFVAVPEDSTVAAALDHVRSTDAAVTMVYLVNGQGLLAGFCKVTDLLRCDQGTRCTECGGLGVTRIRMNADFADVALLMADYNLTAVPVVDDDDRLLGDISVDDVLENLIPDEWRRRTTGSAG